MAQRLVASNIADKTIIKHVRALTTSKEALETAQGAYRAALKLAKGDGLKTGLLIQAMAARKRELEDVQSDLRDYTRYLGLLDMPMQPDLFAAADADARHDDDAEAEDADDPSNAPAADPDDDPARWRAEQLGFKAGEASPGVHPADVVPYAPGARATAWALGFERGQASLAPVGGVKKANLRRRRSSAATLN